MAKETDIEWPDSTLNLEMGCAGCELWNPAVGNRACYAGVLTAKYAGQKGWPTKFESPMIFPERMDVALSWPDLRGVDRPGKPWLNGLPRIVFVNDMGDTFTEGLDRDWLAPYLERMAGSPHQWLILTKRAQRLAEFAAAHPLPSNVWPGVSVTSEKTVGRLAFLGQITTGGPKWVSFEPALSDVDWGEAVKDRCPDLAWMIPGGLSGMERPTPISWIRNAARLPLLMPNVSIFVKQLGSVVHEDYYMQHDMRRDWLAGKVGRSEARIMIPGGKPGYMVEWDHRTHGQPAPGSVFEWRATKKGGIVLEWPNDLRIRNMPIGPVAKPGPAIVEEAKGTLF